MGSHNRKSITKNEDALFLSEVNGFCPKCGKPLIKKTSKSYIKQYEIAHIYPCNPTSKDLDILKSVAPPINTEAFENKIALCFDCHNEYDEAKRTERYFELCEIKSKLLNKRFITERGYYYPLEDEISVILSKLSNITDAEIGSLKLNMKALKIKDKLEEDYRLLRAEIEGNVTKYFALIQKMLKARGTERFELIALQVRSFYIACTTQCSDKTLIFDEITKWISIKSKVSNKRACAIIAAFFVQNC